MIRYEDILLLPVTEDDYPFVKLLFRTEKVSRALTQEADWINDNEIMPFILGKGSRMFIVVKEDPKPRRVGFTTLKDIDFRNRKLYFDASAAVDGEHVGVKIFDALVKYSFEDLNMNQVCWRVRGDNKVALRMFRRKGAHLDGVLRECTYRGGSYVDKHLFSILRSEYRG